ncbi:hypothetical protein JW998_04440 [candidate division KSB1 bacterium]|nr:hypothetical protein [candidate division KSB1 bacterium]
MTRSMCVPASDGAFQLCQLDIDVGIDGSEAVHSGVSISTCDTLIDRWLVL